MAKITGNWIQELNQLLKKDVVHGVLFNSLDGGLILALYSPNKD